MKTITIIIMLLGWLFSSIYAQWEKRIIEPNVKDATTFNCADIDNDGDIDIVAAKSWTQGLAVYVNNDNTDWVKQIIEENKAGVGISIVDMNEYGKLDIVWAAYLSNKVMWYQNMGDSTPSFTPHIVANLTGPEFTFISDIDNDGDKDIVVSLYGGNSVKWLENDGNNSTWTRHTIDNYKECQYLLCSRF